MITFVNCWWCGRRAEVDTEDPRPQNGIVQDSDTSWICDGDRAEPCSTARKRDFDAARLLSTIDYCGPWERLQGFFYGVRKNGTIRWEIPENPRGWRALLGFLGDYCNRRDLRWHDRYAARRPRGIHPWQVWRRR